MIIIVQDRNNEFHFVDLITSTGTKWTFCSKRYSAKEIVNTFTVDEAVPMVCRTCYEAYKNDYSWGGKHVNPRSVKSPSQSDIIAISHITLDGEEGVDEIYWFLTKRFSRKISKYHRHIEPEKSIKMKNKAFHQSSKKVRKR